MATSPVRTELSRSGEKTDDVFLDGHVGTDSASRRPQGLKLGGEGISGRLLSPIAEADRPASFSRSTSECSTNSSAAAGDHQDPFESALI